MTKKNDTQCSVGHINCLNVPKTERREEKDLAEMAVKKQVTTDITQ